MIHDGKYDQQILGKSSSCRCLQQNLLEQSSDHTFPGVVVVFTTACCSCVMWLFLIQITSIRNLVGNGWWFCTSANRSVRVVTLLSIFQRIISWSDIITNLCFDSCHRPVRIALPSFLHFVLYSVSVRPQQIMHAIVAINQSDLFDVWISTYMWATMRG